jgi:hypothetical protein
MTDEERPENLPPVDPFEAELVAYLDGELDPAAAQRIEERLAADPGARAKASALKKTFELLDFLPKPEPSPTFTTRTLDKLPAVKSGSLPVPIPSGTIPQSGTHGSRPHQATSSSMVPLSSAAAPAQSNGSSRNWLLVLALLTPALVAIGYFGAAGLKTLLSQRDSGPDELPLSDHRIIENLLLYAAADDYEFIQRLAEPDLFGGDPAAGLDAAKTPITGPEANKPSRATFDALAQSFRGLPAARQQAIRELDQQLHSVDADTRERLLRALEAYGIWLDRLPEAERKGVFAAATPGLRLGVIRDIRERQWLDGLPASQRSQLAGLEGARKAERIQQWKEDETRQRNLWYFVRRNAEAITGNKAPWPFDNEARRKQVIDFIRTAYRTDEPKRTRLTAIDLAAYREALASAERSRSWAWYGKAVYDLTRSRRYEILPEAENRKLMVVDFDDLPPALAKFADRPMVRKRLAPFAGRWPDFALELHNEARQPKLPAGLFPALGPARAADFKEPLPLFWEKELAPRLSPQEKNALQDLENRWPEYPREFIRLARVHDLSVPGVMLPGSPRRWDATYGEPFRMPRP